MDEVLQQILAEVRSMREDVNRVETKLDSLRRDQEVTNKLLTATPQESKPYKRLVQGFEGVPPREFKQPNRSDAPHIFRLSPNPSVSLISKKNEGLTSIVPVPGRLRPR
ncbi:hypothetical protein [Ferviditalea candida]|uniref:Uncharacterized protein n=1 Tax=Ferviditalea candida TaxID=3108399 RepID=A0ABU5ZPJ4_9BACL|nr:hypothetical protein [Paenibacillaceae bacterium T2]